tara:strand:- start:17271 stop:18200 length:930 start_codon:yes stop_codon:yes gene_type:complete
MDVLIVGNGHHTNKRIIPALLNIESIQKIDIVYNLKNKFIKENKKINYFSKNDTLISEEYNLVIYSTPPKYHIGNLFNYYKYSNNHLIEKPLTCDMSFLDDSKFKNFYSQKNVFESLMYFHHPVMDILEEIIFKEECLNFKTNFSVPHTDFTHYRYKKEEGGGSILDQGVYPISLILYLFGKNLKMISSKIFSDKSFEVDTSGNIRFQTNLISEIIGEWSLGKKYKNYVEITCEEKIYKFPFIFSKNENDAYEYEILKNGHSQKINLGTFNQFEIMYRDILNNDLAKFEYSKYHNLVDRYKTIRSIINN